MKQTGTSYSGSSRLTGGHKWSLRPGRKHDITGGPPQMLAPNQGWQLRPLLYLDIRAISTNIRMCPQPMEEGVQHNVPAMARDRRSKALPSGH